MNNIKIKRVCAYLIDLFIISLLVVMIGKIKVLNPDTEKYQKTFAAYTEYYDANIANMTVTPEELMNKEYAGYMYDLTYYSKSSIIIEVVVIILYLTLFPRFNRDQTIGQRIMKIKVKRQDGKSVRIWQHFVRAIILPIFANVILYNALATGLNVILLFICKGVAYLKANLVITFIFNILCYADIILIAARKDHRSLHDIISKTEVVEIC